MKSHRFGLIPLFCGMRLMSCSHTFIGIISVLLIGCSLPLRHPVSAPAAATSEISKRLVLEDPRTPKLVSSLQQQPNLVSSTVDSLARQIESSAQQSPIELLTLAAHLAELQLPSSPEDISAREQGGGVPEHAELVDILKRAGSLSAIRRIEALPAVVQSALLSILRTQLDVQPLLKTSLDSLPSDTWNCIEAAFASLKARQDSYAITCESKLKERIQSFEIRPLSVAALKLAQATRQAAEQLQSAPLETFQGIKSFSFPTRFGMVYLGGTSDDEYGIAPSALILDLGGNDRYRNGASSLGVRGASSIILDLSGADQYSAPQSSRSSFGSGVLGVGILWDLSGNDRYAGPRLSQGSAVFGVGMLIDQQGNDAYQSTTSSQSSAIAGLATLYDGDGDDGYSSVVLSQGFAGPKASSIFFDGAGNDRYTLDSDAVPFPAHQEPKKNLSLGQGFGFGLRADTLNGLSLAGGVAILFDASGNDRFHCSVQCQGGGYWRGGGILYDAAGSDSYSAYWYGQGNGAHFAFGALEDESGNDTYQISRMSGLGIGHDFSLGFFEDKSGADNYTFGPYCLGVSSEVGTGIFIDEQGPDRFTGPEREVRGWVAEPTNPARKGLRGEAIFQVK